MRCEIRQLIEGDRFLLVVTSSALNRRSIELEKTLVQKGWNGPSGAGLGCGQQRQREARVLVDPLLRRHEAGSSTHCLYAGRLVFI